MDSISETVVRQSLTNNLRSNAMNRSTYEILDAVTDVYRNWLIEQKLDQTLSMDDHLMSTELTWQQRQSLNDFVNLWELVDDTL